MATAWRNPKFDLKLQSKTVLEQATALALALCTLVFLTYRTFEVQAYEGSGETEIIQIEEIPETNQLEKPPPPQRPQIPIATESEDVPDDVTIMDTEIDITATPPPLPPPPGRSQEQERQIFFHWEEPPELIKMVTPDYPEMARQAGVEGKVVLQIVVDEKGNVIEAVVILAQPPTLFDDAAIAAILQWKFKPAKQRDRPIAVRMGQEMKFTLKDIPPMH
jgi:protein TonB